MKKRYRQLLRISLILVFLVIAAGATVRMTGSGMGCPDWPKCFGYLIPPTDSKDLEWQPNKTYNSGEVIILNESLRVARIDFTTNLEYDPSNWEAYEKHDYAKFNVFHTWTEFINRLLGAVAGLAVLITAIISFAYWRERKRVVILSWLTVFGMGFQGWLGATVVYSVLQPVKITIHMVMALVIVAMLLHLIYWTRRERQSLIRDRQLMVFTAVALAITLIQVVLGTQVREFVDERVGIFGEDARNLWLQEPELTFYIHRSFSFLVLAVNGLLAYRVLSKRLGIPEIKWILVLIGFEMLTGILMAYFDFPFASQPLHLVIAAVLFGFQYYILLKSWSMPKTIKTL